MGLLRAYGLRRIAWAVAAVGLALCSAFLLPKLVWALGPGTPVDLHVSAAQAPAIATLTWSPAPDSTPAGYRVRVGLSANGPYDKSYDTTGTAFSFLDGLGGIPYYFRVTALNAAGDESGFVQGGPVAAAWAASPHQSASGTASNCRMCHVAHGGPAGSWGINRPELATTSPEPTALCYPCHDGRVSSAANVTAGTVDSFGLASGHLLAGALSNSLVGTCGSCHAPHAASDSSPMLPGIKVNGVTLASDGRAWCEACHNAADSWFGAGYPSSSSPDRNTSGYPMLGTWPGPSTYSSGSNAHRLIPETTQTVETGAKFKREAGDCRYCHAAHGSQNEFDGLTETFRPTSASTLVADQTDGDFAAMCLKCHGGSIPAGFSSAPGDIKRFATAGNTSAGHRIVTSGGNLPVGAPLPCYDCHNPHGSKRSNASLISDELGGALDTSDATGVRRFCFTCHSTADNQSGWDSTSTAYASVASQTVEGLSRTGGELLLTAKPAHNEGDATNCNDCHGGSYASGGRNVHDPIASP